MRVARAHTKLTLHYLLCYVEVKNYTTRINTLLRIYTVYLGYFFILYLTVEGRKTGSKYIEYLILFINGLFTVFTDCCDTE
jgi:hypothetical protein